MHATLIFTAIAALLVVLGLIWIGARALRALRPGMAPMAGQPLAIRGVLHLDTRRKIYLVGCQERQVLLLIGGGNDVLLGWLPPEHVPQGQAPQGQAPQGHVP